MKRFRVEYLWIALFVILPLYSNPFSRWNHEPDQAALCFMFVSLLVAWSLYHGIEKYAPKTVVSWFLGAYLLIELITNYSSVAPHWSLWGDPMWRNGVMLTLFSALLFELARRQLGSQERQVRILKGLLAGSQIIVVVGIIQFIMRSQFPSIAYQFRHIPDSVFIRIESTLNHPNFFAAYLAIIIPLTIACFINKHANRYWLGMLIAMQLLCLVLTHSRSGWLGALAGIIVFLVGYSWLKGKRGLSLSVTLISVAGGATLLGLNLAPPLPPYAPYVFQTATNLVRWTGATVQIRFYGWEAALQAISERLWFGYGPATYRIVLEWFMPPELVAFENGAGALGGRLHNIFLEILFENGLVGLVIFLSLLGAVLFPLVQQLIHKQPTFSLIKLALMSSLIASIVINLFSVETVVLSVLFWSLAGMAHAQQEPVQRLTTYRVPAAYLAIFVGFMLSLWMYVPDIIVHIGDRRAAREDWEPAASIMHFASQLSPTPEEYMLLEANVYLGQAWLTEDDAAWAAGLAVYDRLLERQPNVSRYWRAKADYLERWGTDSNDRDKTALAEEAYSSAIALNPTDPDLYIDRALVRINLGNAEGAAMDLTTAQGLLPNYSRFYGAMSIYALIVERDIDAAEKWQQRSEETLEAWDAWVWRR